MMRMQDAVERHSHNVDSDDYKLREEVYNKGPGATLCAETLISSI